MRPSILITLPLCLTLHSTFAQSPPSTPTTSTPTITTSASPTHKLEEVTADPTTPKTFSILKDQSLESTLTAWANSCGYSLVWKLPPDTPDIIFNSSFTIPSSISHPNPSTPPTSALSASIDYLLQTLRLQSTIKATFYTANSTLVIHN